jgi:regulation of enolase protein 1 (concanavalin A-like superfamily)
MNHRIPKQLGLAKKLLIAAVGTALLVVLMAANTQFRDEFAGKLEPGRQWIDPLGDSRMSLDARSGFLRITVTGYHDLWPANRNYNAPRLMREVQGDFTVETKIDGPERWCGGLLLWKDQNNFIRFERGIHFKNELSFESANNGEFLSVARDYAAGDPTWLRLQRRGSMVTASYSVNGVDWLPLKRLWRLFAFKKQPPEVEDGRSLLAEEDLEFEPGRSSTLLTSSGALLVGVSGVVPAVAPPVGVKQTVTDYDYLAITTP